MSGEAQAQQCQVTIDVLPDEVLLDVFHFYGKKLTMDEWWWTRLARVCQRWRSIILVSPHFLDLKIICTGRTPTRTSLDTWPPFPILITWLPERFDPKGVKEQDNIIAALEHHDRISHISLGYLPNNILGRFVTLMQEPLPALTHLRLSSSPSANGPGPAPVLPETFLGGSAPRLRSLTLSGVAFPTLPTLLLSSSDLVYLNLSKIRSSMFTSPEMVVTCLGVLPNLRELFIEIKPGPTPQGPTSHPPSSRTVLPSLTLFDLKGISKHLDDLVSRVDTPLLNTLHIQFPLGTDPSIDLSRLNRFIIRADRLWPFNRARLGLEFWSTRVSLGPRTVLHLGCDPRQQLSSTVQLCNRISPLLSHVEQLIIRSANLTELWWRDVRPALRVLNLELFRPFISVQNLYVCEELAIPFAVALRDLTQDRVMEVLPSLRSLSFEGPHPSRSLQETVERFLALRMKSNHPVSLDPWKRDR
ncbi:hypothetical protein BJV74DRAFT_525123 [Russula compacta]|nr:hypothetical protein BJV74DRAFT_525123 [Russula compacta]